METILVGTDFSRPANNAVNYAVELAKYFSAKLVLVNAYSLPVVGLDSPVPMDIIPGIQDASIDGLYELRKEIIRKNYDFGITVVR